jgi:DnaJ-class molecular chaperone
MPLSHAMRMERMTAFVGLDSQTPIDVELERLGAGAGKVRCFECGGSGTLDHFPPGYFTRGRRCPDCKGSGFVLVSV